MFKKNNRKFLKFILLLCLSITATQLLAADDDDDDEKKVKIKMTAEQTEAAVEQVLNAPPAKKGADTCLKCHDEDNDYPIMPLFKTRHASATDPRAPFANEQCESCHGNGGEHMEEARGDEVKAPIFNFGKNAWTPAKIQNQRCMSCHQNHQRIDWVGSTHEFNQVPCAACHQVHVKKDPMLQQLKQADVCYSCHNKQRALFNQVSHHPVREHKMVCSECHNAHGENGTGLMIATSIREKCTSCHAEKRGPFLWEHQPAAEDCTLCHSTHGSNFPALLKKRPPLLCQECHAQAGHPSVSYNGSTIPTVFLGVKGCLNCHSNMHGSNHPSGASGLR